jgi:hypothetical protein
MNFENRDPVGDPQNSATIRCIIKPGKFDSAIYATEKRTDGRYVVCQSLPASCFEVLCRCRCDGNTGSLEVGLISHFRQVDWETQPPRAAADKQCR